MMRVLIMANSYLPVKGGLQTAVHELALKWKQKGIQLYLLTHRFPRTLPHFEFTDGIPIERLFFLSPELNHIKNKRIDLFIASLLFSPWTRLRLRRIIHKFKPDVINLHFPDCQVPFLLQEKIPVECRLVISLHGNEIERWFEDEKPKPVNKDTRLDNLRKIFFQADAITACSSYLKNLAIELEPAIELKCFVIYNGIDLTRFQDKGLYQHPLPYLFAWGRLTYKKGFDLLLKAFVHVTSEHPEIELIIAGEGEEKQSLLNLACKSGISKKVKFWGWATQEEIVRLLNGCLAAVIPSRQEPFGIAALEALAAGKPLIATRVGGVLEFTRGADVIFTDPDPQSIEEGIKNLLSRSFPTMVSVKNQAIAKQYTWDNSANEYLKVFQGQSIH